MALPSTSRPRRPARDRLSRRVREMLAWRAPFDTSDVQIRVAGDVVTLSGAVESVADAHEAARLARSVIGVGTVYDALIVK